MFCYIAIAALAIQMKAPTIFYILFAVCFCLDAAGKAVRLSKGE